MKAHPEFRISSDKNAKLSHLILGVIAFYVVLVLLFCLFERKDNGNAARGSLGKELQVKEKRI